MAVTAGKSAEMQRMCGCARATSMESRPLAPPTAGRAIYGIAVGADIRLFTDFAEFGTALAAQLGAGHHAIALTASGSYEAASVTLHATHIAVHFAPN